MYILRYETHVQLKNGVMSFDNIYVKLKRKRFRKYVDHIFSFSLLLLLNVMVENERHKIFW